MSTAGAEALPHFHFPPPLDCGPDECWLLIARSLGRASTSRDRSKVSAILAWRDERILAGVCDQFPSSVNPSPARQSDPQLRAGMHLDAEAAMLAHAARHGICLNGCTCYVWPRLTNAAGAALLIAAGCIRIVEPEVPIPGRCLADRQMTREMAAESGVLLHQVPISPAPFDAVSAMGSDFR